MLRCKITLTILMTSFLSPSLAQKKPLDHSVYDGWQSIGQSAISKNGHFIMYTVEPQQGNGYLNVTDPKNQLLKSVPRGYKAKFAGETYNKMVFLIKAPYDTVRQARIKKKKPKDMPLDSLGILNMDSSLLVKKANVKSYQVPEDSSEYMAWLSCERAKDTVLHVYHLVTGWDSTFTRVDDFLFSKNGQSLLFTKKAAEKDTLGQDAGVYLFDIKSKFLRQISRGKGTYKQLAFDELGHQIAFAAEKRPEKDLQKPFSLYYYTTGMDTAKIISAVNSTGMPANWQVSGDGQIRFSKNGQRLFFGIAPIPRVKDTTLVDFEHAKLDIWTWQDDYLQPQQLARLKKDPSKSYLSVINLRQSFITVPLADESLPDTRLTMDANNEYVLGMTDVGHRIEGQWLGNTYQDIYCISSYTGKRIKVAEHVRGTVSLSPAGNFILWFNEPDSSIYSYQIARGKTVKLNHDLPVSFFDEDNDVPDLPFAYGVAGWNKTEDRVYIYDKYDIWAFNPMGPERSLISNGAGRSQQLTFRFELPEVNNAENGRQQLALWIDEEKPILLSAFNHLTKEQGFYALPKKKKSWLSIKSGKNPDPELLVMGPYHYSQVKAPLNSPFYTYTKENYQQTPDLYFSANFKDEQKLSAINPWQQNYNWGTAELVKWTTPKGHAAEGILYKPEDFDPAKKYPVIAYFYEKLSDGLYNYIPPAPTPSRLNISYFVSNGYLVLAPDIQYETGYPGRSAEEYVNSGMQELTKNSWVDSAHMGIQGQSWGGYQVAHLITRTNRYAAAWAGAPVANMTSAYGGIRWESGVNRQFQYEHTQSRIGATLWEKPELYIENSPLFHLPNVKTPLVIMSNDEDGAVPWYQGIELFTGLKRLGKPAWLLQYNGEAHNLVQRQNRKDIQIREQQFFDHYLKGKPAPVWMEKGIPATLKGIDWGFDLAK
ncbi:Prolyl oligopeptidase family protein [bacterium A37T11]|nr:Prolyl oligopeptidase family protein [bacterium A37T11]